MTSSPAAPDQDQPPAPAARGFAAELRDALNLRGVLLIVGVFALQLGFVLSYIGAFHAPKPHHIPVAVVAPAQVSGQVVKQLDALRSDPLDARPAATAKQARALILDRTVDAAILVHPKGRTDTLLVASAGGPAVSSTAQQIAQAIETGRHRQVTITDIRPPAAGDGRGMSSFYLVIGWIVGGYMAATILGMAGGARPANLHRTTIRLGSLALYAIASGLGGALIAGPLLGALHGHFAALWALGALVVFAAAATTVAFQVLWGVIGIGVTIVLFVVMGNPSAGGAYPATLLPPFWRTVGQWLPPGAGTTAVRNTVYFSAHAIARPLWVLAGYAVLGTAAAVTASALRLRRHRRLVGA
ncbi:ABC transporter permease [Streptomyces sp. NPDC054770]